MSNVIQATYIDHMGSDLSVVNAARVSFGKKSEWDPNWRDDHYEPLLTADSKLIKYLAKHKHMSPFGHAFASFHVKAPVGDHRARGHRSGRASTETEAADLGLAWPLGFPPVLGT